MTKKKVLKKMFIYWDFEKAQKEAVEQAIIDIINKGKKVCIMIGEIDEKD